MFAHMWPVPAPATGNEVTVSQYTGWPLLPQAQEADKHTWVGSRSPDPGPAPPRAPFTQVPAGETFLWP